MFKSLEFSIPGRAIKRGIITLDMYNPRDYTSNKHNTVDDRPYGGGPGMVMMAEPLSQAIHAANAKRKGKVIYLSPQGKQLKQDNLMLLASEKDLTLICGRYEGIDERIITKEVDEEWSIGDYVLSGGELAAMVMIDAITRLLPGVLGDEDSITEDSFYHGLLDHPHYTRPLEFNREKVPEVLLSGHHDDIRRWRLQQALGRTWQRRPDLLAALALTDEEKRLLQSFINELGENNE